MTVEVYDCTDESITAVVYDDPNKEFLIGEGAKLIRRIDGDDWTACMYKHHELMGWEPYKPFDENETS